MFRKVFGSDFPETYKFEKKGDAIEGIYVKKDEVHLKKYKKTQSVYHIETKEGVYSVWGTGLLDYLMTKVKVGDKIKIVYLGAEKVKGFKNEVHQWDLLVDDGQK